MVPALADVRAVRLLADRVQVPLAHQALEPHVVRPARRAHLQPGRLGRSAGRVASRSGRETPITIVLCPLGRRHYGTSFTSRQPRGPQDPWPLPGASAPGRDGRVHGVADHVHPRAVPRIRARGRWSGRRTTRPSPGPPSSRTTPPRRGRGRPGGDAAESPDGLGRPAHVGAEGPVHRHAHVPVDPVARDAARDVLDHTGRQEPPAVERPPAASI